MSYFNKFLSWLGETETPRWLIAIGFFVTFGLSVATNYWSYTSARTDFAIDKIASLSNDLNVVSAVFVNTLIDESSEASAARNSLSEVIVLLHSELSMPIVELDDEAKIMAADAKSHLEALNDIVTRIDHPSELVPFWEILAGFLESRNELINHYRL